MADIEKIIDNLNLPKQLLEKSEALLKTLFGPSFEELGGMIADQVRLRRYTNQIKIFTKAKEKLAQNNINPKKISLKVLAPLIEYSSLEEDENLQTKWSNLVAHILGGNKDEIFQQNCITILNKISSDEAKLLDELSTSLQKKKQNRLKRDIEYYDNTNTFFSEPEKKVRKIEDYPLDSFTFGMNELSRDTSIPLSDLEFSISNLIALGLLKWETNVEVEAKKSSEDPSDQEIDVDVSVYNNDEFIFTSIGDKFIKVCKG